MSSRPFENDREERGGIDKIDQVAGAPTARPGILGRSHFLAGEKTLPELRKMQIDFGTIMPLRGPIVSGIVRGTERVGGQRRYRFRPGWFRVPGFLLPRRIFLAREREYDGGNRPG